jgi:hypothetical protein
MVFRFMVGMAKWNGFFTSALNLTFSPGKKEQPQAGSGFADDCAANPGAGISVSRRTILLLRGEKAGRMAVVASPASSIAVDKPERREYSPHREPAWTTLVLHTCLLGSI